LPWKFARLYRKVDFTSALAWAGKGARNRSAAKGTIRCLTRTDFIVSGLRANDVPFVLKIINRLITNCYSNIENVTAGAMGNSRRGFGVFTDIGKLPVYWVKSP
jgi:hypothetical protein